MAKFERLTVAVVANRAAPHGWAIGSGVAIADGLVLTAKHVAEPDHATDEPVQVRFLHSNAEGFREDRAQGKDGFNRALCDDTAPRGVVWSDEALDLAVVRVEHPFDIKSARISPVELDEPAAFLADAIPLAAWENNFPKPRRISGKLHTRWPNTHRCQVNTDVPEDTLNKDEEGWSGASGAGIFVGNWLRAVLLTRKPNGGSRTLEGVPIVDALLSDGFRSALGLHDAPTRLFMGQITKALAGIPPAIKTHMAARLGLPDPASDEIFATQLLALPLEDGLPALKNLRQDPQGPDPLALQDLALAYALAASAPDNLQSLQVAVFSPAADFETCIVGTTTLAEFKMAAADGREAVFHPREGKQGDEPIGRYALPSLPDAGGKPAGSGTTDIDYRLGADLLAVDQSLLSELGTLTNAPMESDDDLAKRRLLIYDELDYLARTEENAPTYYFVEPDPGAVPATAREALTDRLREIRKHYPRLGAMFIDTDLIRDERRTFRPLLDLMPLENPDA